MEIIRRRNNSPETCRLVEQRNQLSRPGTLRRRYDQYTQRTVFAPSRPNKRSREEIAGIDAELMRRANRLGGGYQPITEEQDEPEELREEGELEIENAETEEDSIIMRGDNLPIVDLSKYNTHRQNSHQLVPTNPCQKQHEEGRPGNNSGWLPDSIRQTVNKMGTGLRRRPNRRANRP